MQSWYAHAAREERDEGGVIGTISLLTHLHVMCIEIQPRNRFNIPADCYFLIPLDSATFSRSLCLQATDMKQHFSLLSIFNTKLLPTLLALHTTTILGCSATASQLTPLPTAAAENNSRPRQSSLDNQGQRLSPCSLDEEHGSLALQVGCAQSWRAGRCFNLLMV